VGRASGLLPTGSLIVLRLALGNVSVAPRHNRPFQLNHWAERITARLATCRAVAWDPETTRFIKGKSASLQRRRETGMTLSSSEFMPEINQRKSIKTSLDQYVMATDVAAVKACLARADGVNRIARPEVIRV
jgi:hypothetical protein